MSTRALRKLHNTTNDLLNDSDNENDEDSDSSEKKVTRNPYDLLLIEESKSQSEDELPIQEIEVKNVKKTKKKKKKKVIPESVTNRLEDEDEIESCLREVNNILGEMPVRAQSENPNFSEFSKSNSLLCIDHRSLNPSNEMKKKFGSRVVQSESNNRRNHRTPMRKTYWLVQPKNTWPTMRKNGLNMELVNSENGIQYFQFVHDLHYQKVQYRFYDAVDSMDPQRIMNILQSNPYHIDSLLQLSEICKMGEDHQTAADLIERALYSFESNFHILFSPSKGNCRMDFRYPENRAFYLAIYRHLIFIGQRGCYRTALEFTKLLLCLDPDNDPLGALLMIDFYAIRSHQGEYLYNLYNEWEAERNLSQLPNFAFSVPLVLFHDSRNKEVNMDTIDKMLQDAIIRFPGFLIPLLDKCGVRPDDEIMKSEFFGIIKQNSQPVGLRQLISLYIARCFSSWKDTDVVYWLERNVKEVLIKLQGNIPVLKENEEACRKRYQGMPRNILRHIKLADLKDVTAALPVDLANEAMLSYDPLPPDDNVVTYHRPERQTVVQQSSNPLSMFFQSLLPNFNLNEYVDDSMVNGAVGEDNPDERNLRQGITNLMDAMRNLLVNIQPIPPHIENEMQGENDNEEFD